MLIRYPILFALGAFAMAACDKPKSDTESQPTLRPELPSTANEVAHPPAGVPSSMTTTTGADIDPVAAAQNSASIKRFTDESKLPPTLVKIGDEANVRSSPQGGDKITFLGKGTNATEVARARDYFLVVFSDPKDASKKMAGWVYKDEVDNGVADRMASAPSNSVTCKGGETRMRTNHEFCATACNEDVDCRKVGGACDGLGRLISATGLHGSGRYCVGGTAQVETASPH